MDSGGQLIRSNPNGAGNRVLTLTDLGVKQVIDTGSVIHGDFDCSSSILVKGTILGNVSVSCQNSTLVVHPDGSIKGNVTADNVIVAGAVDGAIVARKTLRICATGTVQGSFVCEQAKIDPGARLFIASAECTGMPGSVEPAQESHQEHSGDGVENAVVHTGQD